MALFGKYPAFIKSYNAARRECRVEVPGITDGCQTFPLAQIAYPVGDKSTNTEIRILAGDPVWVEFEAGDERFPIITHWRTVQAGNGTDWRRWAHKNIETTADVAHKINAGETIDLDAGTKITLKVGGSTVEVSADGVKVTAQKFDVVAPESTFSGKVSVLGLLTYAGGLAGSGGSGASMTGTLTITSGDVRADGIGLKTHTHLEMGDGQMTGPGAG